MATVGNILEYKKDPKEDFYAILGCDEHSSVEQIQAEYKVRALQCHPDKNKGDKDADEKFQLLNEAKETLCNPEKKACYDKWKNSGIAMSYRQYLSMKEHVQQSMHWSTPKTKDRMLDSGSSGPSSLGSTPSAAAQRRASEGGANLHWNKNKAGAPWDTKEDAHSEITAKFSPLKNIQAKKVEIPSNGGSGPSSLTIAGTPPAHRRASEGGAHLLMKTKKTDASEKSHQV